MNPIDVLAAVNRTAGQLEEALARPADLPGRTRLIAELLRRAWPSASFSACLLASDGASAIAVLDEKEQPHVHWQERLARAVPGAKGVREWGAQLNSRGHTAAIQPLPESDHCRGLLALILPAEKAEAMPAKQFLESCARTLALLLDREQGCRACEALQEEVNALDRLASKGELAGPLSHEFSNFLNVLLLQVAVLEYQFPEEHRADFAEIRRQGNLAAEVVNQFHQYRRGEASPRREVDLQRIVAETANDMRRQPDFSETVDLVLPEADGRPLIQGTPSDVRRLVRFLMHNALRAAALGGNEAVVRVERNAEGVVLRVEDSGPSPAAEDLPRLFDLTAPNREGADMLELAACRSLARRLNCNIRAEGRAAGGLCILVEFGADKSSRERSEG